MQIKANSNYVSCLLQYLLYFIYFFSSGIFLKKICSSLKTLIILCSIFIHWSFLTNIPWTLKFVIIVLNAYIFHVVNKIKQTYVKCYKFKKQIVDLTLFTIFKIKWNLCRVLFNKIMRVKKNFYYSYYHFCLKIKNFVSSSSVVVVTSNKRALLLDFFSS